MKIITVINPIYSKADNSSIDCIVTFDEIETHPFTAIANADTDYGAQLWADLNLGKYGLIAAYISPAAPTILEQIAALEAMQTLRRIREGGQWMADLDNQIAALRAQLT